MNSVGCVLGAIFSTFVLLPFLGAEVGDRIIVAIYAGLGLLLLLVARPTARVRLASLLFALACFLFLSTRPSWNPLELTSGENVYFKVHQVYPDSKLVFWDEDAYGGITTVVENPPRVGTGSRAPIGRC